MCLFIPLNGLHTHLCIFNEGCNSFPMKRSISLLRLGFGRLLITLSHHRKKSSGARIASDNYRAPQLKFLVRLKGGLHVSFSLKL